MKILVFSNGLHRESICIDFALFDMEHEKALLRGAVERVGQADSALILKKETGRENLQVQVPTCADGVKLAVETILSTDQGVVGHQREIQAIGHRVVHGGEKLKEHCIIDEKVVEEIRQCIPLAPLHNPYNLLAIETCRDILPGIINVAVFDTCFHANMPDYAYIYGIPYELYMKYGIRRYGFQGLSHKFLAGRAARLLGRPLQEVKLITCHLGDGDSIAAIDMGISVDTSMGFTPLEGLVMATRCGDLDASILTYLTERNGCNRREMEALLFKKGGLLGLSSISGSMPELLLAREEGSYRAKLAVDIFCYRLKKYIAAYMGALGGADAIVFTAETGETCPVVREKALEGLAFMGISLDPDKNRTLRGEGEISTETSPVKVFVIPSEEDLVIAQEAHALTKPAAL
jgi:acetate kinase